jgi:hypothetical protein
MDFGICKQVNADSSTTSPGLIMGSPDYMAPEQAAGLAATTSSDIYAVGCILYETLTGRLPFEGRNAVDVLLQKGVQEADPPTRYRPDLPPVLSDVVTRCLRRNPEERPPSMRALEYELTRAVEGRANAVAAVLGLGFGMDTEPSTRITDDPPSGQTGAIASPMAPMLEEPSTRPTMLPPGHPAEVTQPGARGLLGLAAGVKAILFMVLGALLVGVAVLVFSPDSASQIGRDLGLEVEGKAPLDGVAPPPPQQAVIPSATRPDFGSDPIKDRLKRADSNPEDAESVEELVAQADAAAADGRWSEPADQSVVVMLSRLALIDPGNDAIGRLRKQAASELLPAGDKALKDKDWAKAATSFRGVVSIWPDREDAREGLLRALRALGVVHRRDKDYQAALSTADEILNYEPEDLRALLLRAQMLGELDRWEESKDAYAAAKKLKPSSKVARKGYAKAAQKARKQARLRRKKK